MNSFDLNSLNRPPVAHSALAFGPLFSSGLRVLASLSLLAGCLWGCSAAQTSKTTQATQTTVVIAEGGVSPRLDFEDLRLLMSPAQAVKRADELGWRHTIAPRTGLIQSATAEPLGGPVARYELRFEGGQLIGLTLHYRHPDLGRLNLRKAYATKRLQRDGSWSMTDAGRQTIVTISQDGARLVAVHVGQAKNRAEVKAMFELLFDEKPGAKTPKVDPLASEQEH